ncbi:MAG TPA: Wzz/FepE/Etk N-terminal domain-containing protein [Terracidiphilus sp.]|nr:Wzz/FepE/Etk N-terminal domain-containing protein [Terracidiphilus sp.]
MQSLQGNAAVQDSGSLRSAVEAAFRYRRLWVLVTLGVIALTLVYTLLTPKEYRSEMELLVQNTRGSEQITPDRNNGAVTINDVTEEQINSEIELLRSRGLANVVVDPQWNSRQISTMSKSQLKAHDKAVTEFEKHLSTELVRKSNVIHLTYAASDPHQATEYMTRLLTAFLAKQRDIAQPPGTADFFASEADRYKKELDDAQQKLAAFQQQQQIVSLPDTEQNVDNQINAAEVELRSTDAQISELTHKLGTQTRQLKGISTRQTTVERTVPNEYSIEQLNTMLAELENKRTSLRTKFTDNDRLVQEINKQVADTKAALANAQHMTSQERSSDVNPVWQTLTASIVQNESDRQALKARHDALVQQIADLRGKLSNVEGSTVDFTTLHQKVTDLQNNYQLYTQKRDEARMADAMNANKLLNVAVAQSPTFTVSPFRPRPAVDMALGGFTAIILASFVVFFAEMGRSTIASANELESVARFPVLAVVPLEGSQYGELPELADGAPVFVGMTSSSAMRGEAAITPALTRYRTEPQAL